MTARYAQNTSVSSERSRTEIERILRRFAADQFAYGWAGGREVIGFRLSGRSVRITLPMPDPGDPAILTTPSGRQRSQTGIDDEYAKEVRRRWRSLVLVIKAKLTAVADGISTIEHEFLADVVLDDGQTIGEWAGPQLERVASQRELLPGPQP